MPAPDPVVRYLETFTRLRARKRWYTDIATMRFVALTLGAAGIELAENSARASHGGAGDLAALKALRDLLDAQEAATIAALSAAGATSGGS